MPGAVKKDGGACFLCNRDRKAPILAYTPKVEKPERKKYMRPLSMKCKEFTQARDKHVLKPCAKCGVMTQIHSRGLGGACRHAEMIAGTLDINYPARKRKK